MRVLTQEKTNWKYILIVAILAVIVGGGIFGYQWWMEKQEMRIPELKIPEKVAEDETADWKTYTNEDYGFGIRYPENWEANRTCPSIDSNCYFREDDFYMIGLRPEGWPEEKEKIEAEPIQLESGPCKRIVDKYAITIEVHGVSFSDFINPSGVGKYTFGSEWSEPGYYRVLREETVKEITIGDQQALEGRELASSHCVTEAGYRETLDEENKTLIVSSPLNDRSFVISLKSEAYYYVDIFDKIASSFKFTRKKSSEETEEEDTLKEMIEIPLDNKYFLNLMFPEKKLEEIDTKTFKDIEEKYDKYRVENIFRASFTEPDRKELLVIVEKTPTYHVTGLYNAYVAVFDEETGEILTETDLFGGDEGKFGFYNCKGKTLILYASTVTFQGWTQGGGAIFEVKDGKFERVDFLKTWTSGEDTIFELEDNKLLVYERRIIRGEEETFVCPTKCLHVTRFTPESVIPSSAFVYSYDLYWNQETCDFEKE